MKRRKRKQKATPAGSTRPSAKPPVAASPRRGRQTGLLLLAMGLIVAAVTMNVRRLRQEEVPDPLPLPEETISSRPLAPASGDGREMRFTKLSVDETGVEFTHPVLDDHPRSYLYFSSMASGGTAIGDVNNDGRPDLFLASGPASNRLYLQGEQPFQFVDVTSIAGVGGGDAWGCGATMVDINADGRLDIFVANYDTPNHLYLNLGNGRFRDVAPEYDINITDASLEGVFADYDRDGLLDHYLLTYRYENPAGMPRKPPIMMNGTRPIIRPGFGKFYETTLDSIGYGIVGRADGLLRNTGQGTFVNVTESAGIAGAGHGQSATWWDYNADGFLDLYVGNDFNDPDRLYRNNGDGTFTNVIHEVVPHTTWFSMGSDAGDVNGDGWLDFLSTDMSSTTHYKQKTTMGSMSRNREFLETAVPRQYMRNTVLLNSGRDRFQEAAYLTGLDSTDWTWSAQLIDLDCDGKLDAFFTNGSVRSFTDADRTLTLSQRVGKTEWDLYKDTEPLQERNLAFRNQGDLQFQEVGEAWALDHLGVSMSSASGDFDGDGDLDLVVAHVGEPLAIYRNDAPHHRRITLRLHGADSNRFALGATVRVTSGAGQQVRELHPSRGFLACNQPVLHFGCGEAEHVDLEVQWPRGGLQKFASLATGRHYEIKETVEPRSTPATRAATSYRVDSLGDVGRHRENAFDDYALQPLLPHRLSQLGPALAAGDVNGDGQLDYFIGGAAGQPGQIVLYQGANEGFAVSDQPALREDQAAEDAGATWLDFDGDGDADLLVAGGGNEFAPDADQYQLRLYQNEQGSLRKTEGLVPTDLRVSAGPLAAADIDQDGDLDVFVGGRQIPGKYPLPATSYLLINEDGIFRDRTKEWAPSFAGLGLVTGGMWTDVDNDRDLDLMVTSEWGPIQLFLNEQGTLRDHTATSGLSAYRGWWTGVSSGDFDRDGDLDYIATNMGLNTKYHASDKHPFRLYYGDFEGNGVRQLVEAEYEDATLFPVRGKSCSTHAMPSLANKFKTYKQFAAASLEEIYTPQCLEEAYQVSANFLATAMLLNKGDGTFDVRPLPAEAQLSPGFGVVVAELTGDEYLDVWIAQNFFSPQPETGNMDGGLGCLLAGSGNGTFRTVAHDESGILIPEDATATSLGDWNQDGRPDLLVATNNGPLKIALSQPGGLTSACLQVRFDASSAAGLVGTRVVMEREHYRQMLELSSGSGYLTQLPPLLCVPADDEQSTQLRITWPDGNEQVHRLPPGTRQFTVPSSP